MVSKKFALVWFVLVALVQSGCITTPIDPGDGHVYNPTKYKLNQEEEVALRRIVLIQVRRQDPTFKELSNIRSEAYCPEKNKQQNLQVAAMRDLSVQTVKLGGNAVAEYSCHEFEGALSKCWECSGTAGLSGQ